MMAARSMSMHRRGGGRFWPTACASLERLGEPSRSFTLPSRLSVRRAAMITRSRCGDCGRALVDDRAPGACRSSAPWRGSRSGSRQLVVLGQRVDDAGDGVGLQRRPEGHHCLDSVVPEDDDAIAARDACVHSACASALAWRRARRSVWARARLRKPARPSPEPAGGVFQEVVQERRGRRGGVQAEERNRSWLVSPRHVVTVEERRLDEDGRQVPVAGARRLA